MKIAHNVFFVTGGASGLGLAVVHDLVRLGAYVAVLDMNQEAGARIEMELREVVLFIKCDVRSEAEILHAFKVVDSHKGWKERAIGGVVHCGGVGMAGRTIGNDGHPFDLDVFREVIDINLVGSFNVARLVAQRIIQKNPPPPDYRHQDARRVEEDRGVIIFTSSVAHEEGQMGQTAYASSKAGVVGMVLPMARDLAKYGIRVLAIAPSIFDTSMGEGINERAKAGLLATTLFPARFGKPAEFAHLVMACIENQMLNGSVIRIDGGSRMAKM